MILIGAYGISSSAGNAEEHFVPSLRDQWFSVGGTGPGNYSHIQDAIDNASNGDTIFVYDDSSPYYEHLVVDKSITLCGEERNTTIIDGMNTGPIIRITADGTVVNNFGIINSGNASGITCSSSYDAIQSCIFTHTQESILFAHSGLKTSQGIYIADNSITDARYGILLMDTMLSTVSDNRLMNNTYGITVDTIERPMGTSGITVSFSNSISNNYISGSTIAITVNHSSGNHLYGNVIKNNIKGIFIYGTYGAGCGNTLSQNILQHNDIGVVMISGFFGGASDNTITNNTFVKNTKNVRYSLWGTNTWDGNYWGKTRYLPYPLFGWMHPNGLIGDILPNLRMPWVQFDTHPAREPYTAS